MTGTEPFVELHLYGDRFRHHQMPLAALSELVAYQDLLVEVAKGLFKASHPDRERVPARFSDKLQLSLGAVRDGCVTAVLERPAADFQQGDFLTQAQAAVERAVEAAFMGRSTPADFPSTALPYFGRFGRTLHDGDSIQLRAPGADTGVEYTPTVRRRLMPLRSDRFLAETELVGRVTKIDINALVAALRLDDGSQVECPFEEDQFDFFRSALALNEGPKIRVTGLAEVDENQHPVRMVAITSVERNSRIDERLGELASLDDGWLGPHTESPKPQTGAVATARLLAHRLEETGINLRIYPRTEGGISLQSKIGNRSATVEIENTLGVYVLIVDTETGEDHELELREMDEDRIVQFVRGGA
ncbi:hypothetical protein ACFZAM_02915 [Streptomyces sp. NPDC008079]|uniref:hypothetical protein n=1 Tax=Streptomyces sp. NPDC008079 TaxID=3364806 RepID=UPI0036EF087F